jgi:Cu(I)/Ag(I) efflux system membrane fusion protein
MLTLTSNKKFIRSVYMKSFLPLSLLILVISIGCSPSEQEQAQQEERRQQMQMQFVESNQEFNDQISVVLDRYMDLKNALVDSDAESAKVHANSLKSEAERVDPEGLNQESLALWFSYSEIISNGSEELIREDDVDEQRYHFEFISEVMIEMIKTFRPVDYTIYHQSCPMVRGGTADWLSREEQIANPYHGDRMMRCGEIIERI